MELTYGGAITMPRNFVPVTEDEMEYIDGGWSMRQVGRNVAGILAVFSIGYAGKAFHDFVKANPNLKYHQLLVKCAQTIARFLKALPWKVKLIVGACAAVTMYALGQWDLF